MENLQSDITQMQQQITKHAQQMQQQSQFGLRWGSATKPVCARFPVGLMAAEAAQDDDDRPAVDLKKTVPSTEGSPSKKVRVAEPKESTSDEAGKAEAGKAEAGKAEAGKAEAGKAEAGKAEASKAESGQAKNKSAVDSVEDAPLQGPSAKKVATKPPAKAPAKKPLSLKKQMCNAGEEYIKKNLDSWTLSLMTEEMAEEEGWENNQPLKAIVKGHFKTLGFSGGSAAVPQKAAAWYRMARAIGDEVQKVEGMSAVPPPLEEGLLKLWQPLVVGEEREVPPD